MRGDWGLVLFFKDTFAIFPPFPEIISNCAIRLCPSWFLFQMSPRVTLVPQGPFCWLSPLWPPTRAAPAMLPHSCLPTGVTQRCSAPSPRRHWSTRTHANDLFCWKRKKKKEGKTFHSILVIYSLLTKSQTFPKKVNSFHENFLLIANHVFSKTSESTVLCLSHFRPFKGGDL